MNDFTFLLFTSQKYSSFNPPYFPKRTLKFFLNSIPACSVLHCCFSKLDAHSQSIFETPKSFNCPPLFHSLLTESCLLMLIQKWSVTKNKTEKYFSPIDSAINGNPR